MIKADNTSFLKFLENESIIKNFYTCEIIVNAGGPGYAIKSISFFTADGAPSNSYVSFSENIYNDLIVEFKTKDPDLISAALCETKTIAGSYENIRFGAASREFYEAPVFKKLFKVKKTFFAEYGVFAQFSKSDLPQITVPGNVTAELVSNTEKAVYAAYDDTIWDGLPSVIQYGNDTDKLFILKENGIICGYLMANSSYKNVYDIANVFVAEAYRGKNYGTILAVTFASHCYANGLIPHYGTAVSKYSEAVALKSGFKEAYRQYYVDAKARSIRARFV